MDILVTVAILTFPRLKAHDTVILLKYDSNWCLDRRLPGYLSYATFIFIVGKKTECN